MTKASDAWMSVFERCFLNPGFCNCGQHRPNLFWKTLYSGLFAAFSAVCLQRLPVHPESHFQRRRYCYALPYVYVCSGVHVI